MASKKHNILSRKKVSFLSKIEPKGIRLEDVQRAKFKDKVVTEKSTNPVIIFFGK